MRARVRLPMCLSAASVDHIRSDSAVKGNTVLYMEESSSWNNDLIGVFWYRGEAPNATHSYSY